LSEDEFWSMTPREYEALISRKQVEQRGEDYRTAAIICATYNVWRDSKYPPLTPEDILGKQEKMQTVEDMLVMVKQLHVAMGGKPPEV
jgi:hypothetical protein